MRCVGHVAHIGDRRGIYKVLVGKPEGKRPLGRPKHRWEDILRWISRKWDVGVWIGSSWLRRYAQVAGTCECGNEPLDSIKCVEFLDWLNTG